VVKLHGVGIGKWACWFLGEGGGTRWEREMDGVAEGRRIGTTRSTLAIIATTTTQQLRSFRNPYRVWLLEQMHSPKIIQDTYCFHRREYLVELLTLEKRPCHLLGTSSVLNWTATSGVCVQLFRPVTIPEDIR